MSDVAIRRLGTRVRLMVGRAVLALVNDAAKLQAVQVQLQADVARDRAEHFQHYGFTSVAFPGAEGIALAVGGSTDHVVVINVDDRRYRLKGLADGEVAIYDDQGQKVHLTRNGIVVDGGGKPITYQNAPVLNLNVGSIKHNGKEIGGTHTHNNVQPGVGVSGQVS